MALVERFVITDTTDGQIQGYSITLPSGGQLEIYLGIPFAEPPVGDLRFAPPKEKVNWRPHILNATRFGPACPQPLHFLQQYSFGKTFSNIEEDCLYLNVYAPKNTSNVNQLFPVMVWIHGGSYRYGSGSEFDGRILASRGGVIVVTVNYRLGALGFLSTDDSVTSGNQGLLDQVLALKWVNRNIRHFGGNPDQVTLFGQSAGGASVSLHMFSPLSNGLFQALIPQSGCALSPFSIYRPPHSITMTTRNLALMLQCPVNSSQALVDCLRQKSAHDVVNTYPKHPQMIAAFAPRVDGYFIHDVPENLLDKGNFNKNIRVMTGFVPNESADEIPDIFNSNGGYDVTYYNSLLDNWSRRFLHGHKVKSAVTCYYSPLGSDDHANVQTYMQLKSDYGYIIPHIQLASKLNLIGTKTWLYDFNYRSSNYPMPDWMGIIHASELYYLFGTPLFTSIPCPGDPSVTCPQIRTAFQTWNQLDTDISKATIDLWSNFAKLGTKNVSSIRLSSGGDWDTFYPTKQYLMIGDSLQVRNDPRQKELRLWNNFDYQSYYANPRSDCSP
ncbi:acetylcholinesterase-like [Saccostrea echinata]|uniref:acetylcholinesterase-like n=1 Tax=Saccostrea echinata TaxID=191078 RepID=UPI002A82EEB3|nr:acetylcholinesterase-like [Saccostrea echinata]